MGEIVNKFFSELSETVKIMMVFVSAITLIIGGFNWWLMESIDNKLEPIVVAMSRISSDYQEKIIQDIEKQAWKIQHDPSDIKEIDLKRSLYDYEKLQDDKISKLTEVYVDIIKDYYLKNIKV